MQANRRRRGHCSHAAVQRAVLALTLEASPNWTRMGALRRDLGCGGVVHHAIRDLIAVGLIEREGASIRPTQAAVLFERLELP